VTSGRGSPTREELLIRCRLERNELIAVTAGVRELLPRGRKIAHWVRATSRMLRVVASSVRGRNY
jgi:hypothetical protein